MRVLKLGLKGPDVLALQQALAAKGFSPGNFDSSFGRGTQMAVAAFQASEGLLSDGVAGPRTQAVLGLVESNHLPDATGDASVQIVSEMFPATPIGNIKRNLPIVLEGLRKRGLHDRAMVLMALATIRAETAPFMPLNEGVSRFNTSPNGHPFDLYDMRRDLGNQGAPDGARFKGRGFVQLTGRANYRTYGLRLLVPADLEKFPDLAGAAEIAADILALFLADRELQIKDALMHGNLMAARRLVNGGVHGLADFSAAFETGDRLMPAAH